MIKVRGKTQRSGTSQYKRVRSGGGGGGGRGAVGREGC